MPSAIRRAANAWTTALALCFAFAGASRCAADDQFRRQVAPILQQRCLTCHNDDQQKGGFSLQTAQGALASGFIEPGDAAASYLVDTITPVDGRAAMPKSRKALAPEEIAAIKQWIDAGASWPDGMVLQEAPLDDFTWWSYQPIRRSVVPKVDDPWVRTPIDALILRKLKDKGLSPAPPADRRTLIRRLTYDLTGLPPTPQETRRFLGDSDPNAYEKLVDRLLKSKRYGERWARHWLDVVQYADTCGYDKDKLRPSAWPYRDYVIRSFNEDKPYAKFVQEQVAGDVLFPGEPDGILGLGFIAAGPWDFIGHVEVPESKIDGKVARNLDRDDMVSNTFNAFCSLTVQCARCHNHKFDPITQEHYYGLQAIFAAVDRAERTYDLDPEIESRRRELTKTLKSLNGQLAAVNKQIADAAGPRLADLEKQIKDLQDKVKVEKRAEFGYHSAIAKTAEAVKWVEVDLGKAANVTRIVLRPCHDEYAGIGAGFGFPVRFKVEVAAGADDWKVVHDQTGRGYPNPGLSPVMIENVAAPVRRIRLTATELAERKNDYILALAELQAISPDGANLAHGAAVDSLDSIEAPDRWAKKNLTDGHWARSGDAALAGRLARLSGERAEILEHAETPERIERRAALQQAIAKAEQERNALPAGKKVYAAATHFQPRGNFKPTEGKLRPVHVLHRGDVNQPRERSVPGALPLVRDSQWRLDPTLDEAQRRAALARWLTDKDHPLVWRSIVNRVWLYHFGQGLVSTPNDFGRMGAKPTHPELLDWLAAEFRDGGQSFKKLHRLIVTSSVYRQSSRHHPDHANIDGGNQYLWRMNRRRLEAEEIRDSILSVSGALDLKMGGPGFYTFELEKTDHSPHYEYHKFDPSDPASHRRSIYRFIVRSQPDPWMSTLDCADSSQSTPRRTETLTSLQALSLLNNRFNLEMARRFAQRLQADAADLPAQVDRAIRLVAQRAPSDAEQAELEAYAKSHGLANMCRLLFNLSEFVFVD